MVTAATDLPDVGHLLPEGRYRCCDQDHGGHHEHCITCQTVGNHWRAVTLRTAGADQNPLGLPVGFRGDACVIGLLISAALNPAVLNVTIPAARGRRLAATDTDILNTRPCPDCGYDIHPGYEHGRNLQPDGGSHVICSLQTVRTMSRFGSCAQCGVPCSAIIRAEHPGETFGTTHHGPVDTDDDHPADPSSAPIVDMLKLWFDHHGRPES